MKHADNKKRIAFYKSKIWKAKRKEIINRDNNECQLCKIRGKVTTGQMTKLDVHHIKFLESNWELRLNNENLITLCASCHNEMHPEKLKETKKNVHEERFE